MNTTSLADMEIFGLAADKATCYAGLFIMALVPIYIGAWRSLPLARRNQEVCVSIDGRRGGKVDRYLQRAWKKREDRVCALQVWIKEKVHVQKRRKSTRLWNYSRTP